MIKIFKTISIILVSCLFACSNSKEASSGNSTSSATDSIEKKPVVQPNDTAATSNYRLLVSFYSIGSGAEHEFIDKMENSVGIFAGEIHKNIDYEKSHWGREGETDFCLRLNELTVSEQDTFIRRTREMLKTAHWVHIYENQPCRHHPAR